MNRKDSFSGFLDNLFFFSPVFLIFGCILTIYAADALPTGGELVSDEFETSNAHTIQGIAEAPGIEIRRWTFMYYIEKKPIIVILIHIWMFMSFYLHRSQIAPVRTKPIKVMETRYTETATQMDGIVMDLSVMLRNHQIVMIL